MNIIINKEISSKYATALNEERVKHEITQAYNTLYQRAQVEKTERETQTERTEGDVERRVEVEHESRQRSASDEVQ